jgi:hypothetical protein
MVQKKARPEDTRSFQRTYPLFLCRACYKHKKPGHYEPGFYEILLLISRTLLGLDEGRVYYMLRYEPHLQLVSTHYLANYQVVGTIVARIR